MLQCTNCPSREMNGFCHQNEGAREFLMSNSVHVQYPRGTTLFREGEAAESIYLLCSGRLKISSTSQEGRTMILRIATSGAVLGLSAAVSDLPYEATAEALEPCRVRVMRTRSFRTLLSDFPQAALGVAESLASDYRAAFEEARRIALPDTPAGRVACLLLDWMAASDRKGGTFNMPLTHEEVACMTATTRETVTRTLSRFKKEGLIQTKGVALTILQPTQLRQLSAC